MTVFAMLRHDGFVKATFDLIENTEHSATERGFALVVGRGVPRWRATYQTKPLTGSEIIKWQTWFQKLRGGVHRFYGVPALQKLPQAYCKTGLDGVVRAIGGSFAGGVAGVTALTSNTISLDRLPANYRFSFGDFVGLKQGTNRALHRVTIAADGDASGRATVNVLPAVLTNVFSPAASAVVKEPSCIMLLEPGSFSGDVGAAASPVSLSAIQAVL